MKSVVFLYYYMSNLMSNLYSYCYRYYYIIMSVLLYSYCCHCYYCIIYYYILDDLYTFNALLLNYYYSHVCRCVHMMERLNVCPSIERNRHSRSTHTCIITIYTTQRERHTRIHKHEKYFFYKTK